MNILCSLLSRPSQWWRAFRARRELRTHGAPGAALREAVRNLEEDEIHEARTAFGLRFQTFSNRSRANWLRENQIRVVKAPGRTVRQDQQVAALAWFDSLHGKKAAK